MKNEKISKLKPYRIYVLYMFIIWYTPAILGEVFGKPGWFVGGFLQLFVFSLAALFLLGAFFKSKSGFIFMSGLFMLILSFLRFTAILNNAWRGKYVSDPMGILIFFLSLFVIFITAKRFPYGFFWQRYLPLFLEVAAKPIIATTNGYTNRPFPVGKSEYSREDIIRFAKFLNQELIASHYIMEDRVVLVFSNGLFQYIPFFKPDFNRLTYVSFGSEGDISVNFAQKDYKKYKDEITFNQLCNSFGNIIIDFFNAFQQKKGNSYFEKIKKEGIEIATPELHPYPNSDNKEVPIKKTGINYKWVILSGLLAFFVFALVESLLESPFTFLDNQWTKEIQDLIANWGMWERLLNLLIAVAKFIIFMWIYAALIPRFGATKKNVLLTSLVVLALIYLQILNDINSGFMNPVYNNLWLIELPFNIIELPISIFAGAMLYTEG